MSDTAVKANRAVKKSTAKTKKRNFFGFKWFLAMLLVSAFQLFSFFKLVYNAGEVNYTLLFVFGGYLAAEWLYLSITAIVSGHSDFELETIAFLLSGIGLVVCASISDSYAVKQAIAVGIGLAGYSVLLWLVRSTDRAMFLRTPVAVCAVGLLGLNLLLAGRINGALNWIDLGVFSVQPSEFVKVAFVFVGAATLDKLQTTKSLTKYVIFAVGCVGVLFLMRDFGTALIFFFAFILIAFMRSGDVRTIVMVCVAALLGAVLVIYFRPYVAARFSTYRHVWEYINDAGYQQTRVLIYIASGGLFGLGIGEGELRNVFAASTDLVFGMLCEEWGLALGITVIVTFAFIALYAVRAARNATSTFYSIAAVAAAGMLLFQLALNVFGVTDLLPLTGVTLPFVSRGGSSVVSAWMLFAFIKAAGVGSRREEPERL